MFATTMASCTVVIVCHQNAVPFLYDRVMTSTGTRPNMAVPQGPREFRSRIRHRGPFVAMGPAAALGVVSAMLLHGNTSTVRGIAGFGAAVLGAPALLAAGVPLATESSRKFFGVVASIALWFAVGVLAARRATRSPVAMWRDFWREFAWLAAGIWIGVGMGLAMTELLVGRALF